jgi:serine/threonine protein phosphatase 1
MTDKTITFAIGDIHGMKEHLHNILEQVHFYIKDNNVEDWKIVFTGDYIDRGPESNWVVSTIRNKQEEFPGKIITLRGNHEQMLLDAINGGWSDVSQFLRNGGDATLISYGVTNVKDIPFNHKQFFKDTVMCYEDEFRYFVHAGVNHSKPLSDQDEMFQLWVREGFLDYPGKFEKFIVHGHTPRPYDNYGVKTNRLNLDFAACFGGSLVCAVFNNEQAEPIHAFSYSIDRAVAGR